MKRRIFVLLAAAALVLAVVMTGCTDKPKADRYFENFSSQGLYTSAIETISLDRDNFSVYSYDAENDVFVTVQAVINEYVSDGYSFLYGLASSREEYIEPRYSKIISINGDYAIVTKPFVYSDPSTGIAAYTATIGVIKFRGEGKGELTTFMTPYNTSFTQFSFVGGYIACPGAEYTTFYDYTETDRLLEVFKIRCNYTYDISVFDDYVVAAGKDHAFFYDINELESNGFLLYDERAVYQGYPQDAEAEYTDYISINIYYIGNGWFSRTARLTSSEPFAGYNIIYEDTDLATGSSELVYANIVCDFYNAKEKSTTDRQGLIVDNVANKYYSEYYSQWSSYLNNLAPFDEETGLYDYSLPYVNVSEMIKDGYSIVYYYYFPYIESGNYRSEITFCLMDSAASVIFLDDMLMPTVFVDGVGVETSDPIYEEYYGSIHSFDRNFKRTEQLSMQSGVNTYITGFFNGVGIIAAETDYEKKTVKYGAVTVDGRVLIPFEYDEMTPFYGKNAMGRKKAAGGWFGITADGEVTPFDDVVNVCQGVYIFEYHGKLGLKNYAGDVLLEANYDELDVFSCFLNGGKLQSNYVIGKTDGVITIYELS